MNKEEIFLDKRIILLIFLFGIIASLSGCTIPSEKFEYIGAKEPVIIPEKNFTVIILDFLVSVGGFTLEINPDAEYLIYVECKILVREGSNAALEKAKNVTYIKYDVDTMKIQFSSDDIGKQVDYGYNFSIKMNNNITLDMLSRIRSIGDISIKADSTINITGLGLTTKKGSISLKLAHSHLSATSIISTSIGKIEIVLQNMSFSLFDSWDISTSTGDVKLNLTNTNIPGINRIRQIYEINSVIGDIYVGTDLHQDYGLEITAGVVTGTITIPGGGETYTSANWITSIHKFEFDLWTETGDITFSTG
jgi:hypothetical protein